MNFEIGEITTNALVLVPIIIALVQAVKLTGWVKDHFAPLLSIGIGVIVSFFGHHGIADLTSIMLSGVVYGLMASGLYSNVKTTMTAHARIKAERNMKR